MADTHVHDEEQEKLEPKVDITEVGPCKVKVTIEIDAAKVKDRIEHKYKDINEKMAFPGFRPGKTPRTIIERKYGKSILEDVKFELLTQSFEEVKEAKKLDPLGEPELDAEKIAVKEGAAFAYDFTIEVKPSFEVKDYKGLKIAKPDTTVADKDVDDHLEKIREHKAELVPAEDGAKEKDAIVADFELVVDGKTHDKSENNQVNLMPDISFYGRELPDFHKAILGKKAGDVVEYPIDLPENFRHKEIAGRKGTIRSTLRSVKRRQLPELNAEFAKTFDLDSVDELKADVRKQLTKQKEREAKDKMGDDLLAMVGKANAFKLPEGYVKAQTEAAERRVKVELLMHGTPEDKLEEEAKKHLEGSQEKVENAIREELIVEQIAAKEKIFVVEDEVEEQIFKMAQSTGEEVAAVRQYLEERNMIPQIRRTLRRQKVCEFLVEKAATA